MGKEFAPSSWFWGKNAINKIHASDKLKAKTLENIENMNSNNTRTKSSYNMLKFLSACAAVFLICFIGLNSVNFNVYL